MLEYSALFNAITDAIELLVKAQQKAEDIILEASDDTLTTSIPRKE